jgi:hypothetical protein
MARLSASEMYRRVHPVDISGALGVLDQVRFFGVNRNGPPEKFECDVSFPPFHQPIQSMIDRLRLGGEIRRTLLRRLAPRQGAPLHVDKWMPAGLDWRRFHIPLVSDEFVIMQWPEAGKAVWLEPGFLWEVRFDAPHEVVNCSDNPRIHLQIDVVDATI